MELYVCNNCDMPCYFINTEDGCQMPGICPLYGADYVPWKPVNKSDVIAALNDNFKEAYK